MKHLAAVKTNTRRIGNKGEDVACKFLTAHGFKVITRNYQRRWGEIDIIAQKDKVFHFFEVKSITFVGLYSESLHKPEENVHRLKLKRMGRMIETFLFDRGETDLSFKVHVLSVYMNVKTRKAKVHWIQDIII